MYAWLSYASISLCQTLHQAHDACTSVAALTAGTSPASARPSVSAQQHQCLRTASYASHRFHGSNKPRSLFLHQLFTLYQLTAVMMGADKMCLVLGVVAQPTLATRQGNTFGTAFRSAADDTEAQTQHDGFDSSIMRVRRTISSCSAACPACT